MHGGGRCRWSAPSRSAHLDGPAILDLGCGSGLLSAKLLQAGGRVHGIDISRAMLSHARRRCARYGRRVRFTRARLAELRPGHDAHLALACQDVVNHMPSLGSVRRSFAAVRRALAPSGWLGFDTITRYCFETYWTDNTHLLEGPLGDVIMSCDCEPKKRRGTARIISYPRRARGGFDRHDTVLYEYFYADRDLARCLREAGFARVWRSPWESVARSGHRGPPSPTLVVRGRCAGETRAGAAGRVLGITACLIPQMRRAPPHPTSSAP